MKFYFLRKKKLNIYLIIWERDLILAHYKRVMWYIKNKCQNSKALVIHTTNGKNKAVGHLQSFKETDLMKCKTAGQSKCTTRLEYIADVADLESNQDRFNFQIYKPQTWLPLLVASFNLIKSSFHPNNTRSNWLTYIYILTSIKAVYLLSIPRIHW